MRDRARSEERDPRQDQRSQQREQSGRIRVPKIQYRFLKELEQRGVTDDARRGALGMADKIKRYPLEARHVMGSWERFTKKAIEEFKAGRGKSDERDRQHLAYAVLFSTVRDAPAAKADELRGRIGALAMTPAEGGQTAPRQDGRAPSAPAPRQQNLLEQPRPPFERQVDASLSLLRDLSPQLRGTIEASARELLVEGHHTPASAREALPGAVREFQADRSERNTVHTLTLAVIARTAEHKALLREVDDLPREQRKEIEVDARARLERYPPLETGVSDVRKDAVEAAVRDAIAPSAHARREALVLAHAREELECVADPKRLQWQSVAEELERELR